MVISSFPFFLFFSLAFSFPITALNQFYTSTIGASWIYKDFWVCDFFSFFLCFFLSVTLCFVIFLSLTYFLFPGKWDYSLFSKCLVRVDLFIFWSCDKNYTGNNFTKKKGIKFVQLILFLFCFRSIITYKGL